MNIQRMHSLAAAFETDNLPAAFGMAWYAFGRRTPEGQVDTFFTLTVAEAASIVELKCCIGGQACLMFGEPSAPIAATTAQELLGLTRSQADGLFLGSGSFFGNNRFAGMSNETAARALRKLIAIGMTEQGAETL